MARSTRSTARRGSNVKVDFTGVEGKRPLVEEGEQLVKVVEVTQEKGDKAPYLKWVVEVVEGDQEGSKLYNNTSLSKDSLWNLKSWLEALGVEVPDDELDIDLEEMIDLTMMVNVEHETYNGKKQARIVDFWPAEEETTTKKKRNAATGAVKRGGKKGDDADKIAQEEVEKMDQEELEDLIKEHKLDVDLDDHKTIRKMRNAVIDALEKEDLLES